MSDNEKIIKGVRRQRGEPVCRTSANTLKGSPLRICSPPTLDTVAKIEEWAADLNLRVVASVDSESAELVRVLSHVLRQLGRMRQKAERAEDAITVKAVRLGEKSTIGDAPPFGDPIAALLWSYRRLATLAFELATGKAHPRKVGPLVTLLGQQGFLPCNDAIEQIADRVQKLDDK